MTMYSIAITKTLCRKSPELACCWLITLQNIIYTNFWTTITNCCTLSTDVRCSFEGNQL